MHNDYFWHDAYSEYPVVGVTWYQAKAFCERRTMTKNAYQKTKKKKSVDPDFRLPTEAEWEWLARKAERNNGSSKTFVCHLQLNGNSMVGDVY